MVRPGGTSAWIERASAGVALALGLVVVHGLWTESPAPDVAVYAPAGAAALALAGFGARAPLRRGALLAACLAFALFVANARRIQTGDTAAAALLPYALLRGGTLALDGVVAHPLPYATVESRGHVWSRYPIVAGLLALPVYVPAALGPGAPDYPAAEKMAAALIAAASAGLVFSAARRLGAGAGAAAAATALYAAGTPVLTTASQALYQHAPGALGVAACAWAALRAREGLRFSALAGLAAGFAVAARPTNALVVGPVLLVVAATGARAALVAAAAAAAPLALNAAYATVAFGAPWRTGYGGAALELYDGSVRAGLAGLLVSPTRGLFTFVPWSALALAGLALGARRDPRMLALLAGVAGAVAAHAPWRMWWGGWCFGPRFLIDAMPLVALGVVPFLARRGHAAVVALAATGAFAVAVHGVGAFSSNGPIALAVFRIPDDGRGADDWRRWPPVSALRGPPPPAR